MSAECDAVLRAHSMRDLRDLQELRNVQGMDNTYRIAEAAKLLGVHPSTLRRWDEKGILPPSIRTLTGERRYTEADLKAITDKEEAA